VFLFHITGFLFLAEEDVGCPEAGEKRAGLMRRRRLSTTLPTDMDQPPGGLWKSSKQL
jgi:hypothetical protein